MDLKTSLTTDLLEYRCADCGGNNWFLRIGRRSDMKTYLLISCSNDECIHNKRKELGMEDDDGMILWSEYDITGQGYDADDLSGLIDVDESSLN